MTDMTHTITVDATAAESKITLTPDQQVVFDRFRNWWDDDTTKGQRAALQGYAGTGKTTCSMQMIEYAATHFKPFSVPILDPHTGEKRAEERNEIRILLAAPTHAALDVLRDTANQAGVSRYCTFRTIQAACAFKIEIDDNGDERCERDPETVPDIGLFDLVISDESGMLNRQIVRFLEEQALPHTRILFMGDPAQPAPVGEIEPSAFASPSISWSYTLTEVVRYSGAALAIATHIRSDLRNAQTNAATLSVMFRGDDTLKFVRSEDILDTMRDAFLSATHPRAARVVAWTNATVKRTNEFVRTKLLGFTEPYCVGEILLANKPIRRWDSLINQAYFAAQNGTMFRVVNRRVGEQRWNPQTIALIEDARIKEWMAWNQVFYITGRKSNGEEIVLTQLPDDLMAWYYRSIKEITDVIKGIKNKQDRRFAWSDLYRFKDMHDPISYGYASTTHKATGQTFDKVFVIDDDFQGAKLPTRNRLRYTAITRARETAYIISRSI